MTARRTIALGAFALLLLGSGASAYIVVSSQDEAIEQALDRLAAYEATIALEPQLEAQLETMRQQSASLAGLVPGTSAQLAAASMQNDVRTITSRVGGEVRAAQNLPPTSVESFQQIEIACDVTLPMNRLKDLLYQLEAHTPYLFLDRIVMEVPQNAPQRAEGNDGRVEISLVVRGYRWVGE